MQRFLQNLTGPKLHVSSFYSDLGIKMSVLLILLFQYKLVSQAVLNLALFMSHVLKDGLSVSWCLIAAFWHIFTSLDPTQLPPELFS